MSLFLSSKKDIIYHVDYRYWLPNREHCILHWEVSESLGEEKS